MNEQINASNEKLNSRVLNGKFIQKQMNTKHIKA